MVTVVAQVREASGGGRDGGRKKERGWKIGERWDPKG